MDREIPIVPTIKEQVYQIIRGRICNGNYPNGHWLQENELAKQLNVSRSPVREALRQLSGDGLTVEIPNKGVFVKALTPKDIEEIFAARVLLESYGIQQSRATLTQAKADKLAEIIREMQDRHRTNALDQYIVLDTQLHALIIELSGNSLIESVYEKIHSLAQRFRTISLLGKRRFDESILEHSEIVESILRKDTDKACRINRKHLELAKDTIIRHVVAHDSVVAQ